MLVLYLKSCVFILLKLCVPLGALRLSLIPELSENQLFDGLIEQVHKEQSVETILIMRRRHDSRCILNDLNVAGIPTLRFEAVTRMNVKEVFNKEALALVCMSEIDDIAILTTLAKNINRMREARIIIWLHNESSISSELMDLISEQANTYDFLNLLVIHSAWKNVEEPIISYRLQPFPSATLQRIINISKTPIFPKVYNNFHGKTAIILPDLIGPRSLYVTDSRTGKKQLSGSSERLLTVFAEKHNIMLRTHELFEKNAHVDSKVIFNMTINGEVDLPIGYLAKAAQGDTFKFEYVSGGEIGSIFIVVPCGQDISIVDVYTGLRTYLIIVLVAYFMFAVIETLVIMTTYWIYRGKCKLFYLSLFLNLRAFCGILGLPIRLNKYRNSISLQQIVMIMSLLSIIFTCFFNANLSTLLTKQPERRQIQNLEELERSGLPILIGSGIDIYVDHDILINKIRNIKVVDNIKILEHLLSMNRSYAYLLTRTLSDLVDYYQQTYNSKVFCKVKGLQIFHSMPIGGALPLNSIYKMALDEFILRGHSLGLLEHWSMEARRKIIKSIKSKDIENNRQEVRRLSFADVNWIFKLIGLCYGIAALVFIGENCLARWQKKTACNCSFECINFL